MPLTDSQIDYLSKEVELTYGQIDKQRESTTEFLKMYLSIIVGLFAYIYFIENRLVEQGQRIKLPSKDYIVFGLFGILICLIAFIIGWALLDNVTKTVYKSIKHYKHISYVRHLINSGFDNDALLNSSILPMKQDKIPMRISAQVPIIGGLFNLGLLALNYYFISLFASFGYALVLTTVVISIVSIFYSNQLEKHFEEILIAQKLRPRKDEIKLKETVKEFICQKKKSRNYVITKRFYLFCIYLFVSMIVLNILNLELDFLINRWAELLLYFPVLISLISIIPRYFMGRHRIENISCFE